MGAMEATRRLFHRALVDVAADDAPPRPPYWPPLSYPDGREKRLVVFTLDVLFLQKRGQVC